MALNTTTGVSISRDRIRCVRVRGERVLWAQETQRIPDDRLDAALQVALSALPQRLWSFPRLNFALGPSMAHTKLIEGLPHVTEATAIKRIAQESVDRFFIVGDSPLVVTGVNVVEPGVAWVAAIEAETLASIRRACVATKNRIGLVVPSVAALAVGIEGKTMDWADGDVTNHVTYDGLTLASVRRSRTTKSVLPLVAKTSLAAIGEEAWRFADAYGAARIRRHPLAPQGNIAYSEQTPGSRVGLVVASLACVASLCAAALLPPAVASYQAARIERRVSALSSKQRESARIGRDLALVTKTLQEVSALSESSTHPMRLLTGLATQLPRESSVISLRVDSTGGSLTVAAVRVDEVLRAAETLPLVVSPELEGPITHEVLGSREFERATIRFRVALVKRVDSTRQTRNAETVAQGTSQR